MFKRIFCMGLLMVFSLCFKAHAINEYWQRLGGPCWVNGVDVGYGPDGQLRDWHRYLVGNDEDGIRPFHWRSDESEWQPNIPIFAANKLISYKIAGYGQIAFCSAFDDRIYETIDGGEHWNEVTNSNQIANKHFSSIEVPVTSVFAGNVVMVASRAMPNVASTYYTENGGTNWNPIGSTSSTGLDVFDMEAFQSYNYPPGMSLGTANGIYVKDDEFWDNPWVQRNFEGVPVPVMETIDRAGDICLQVAAVEEGQDGRCNLYYSGGGGDYFPNWWANPEEIKINGNSFNRVVRDMAAVTWGSSYVSLYVATDEGVFFVAFEMTNPSGAELVTIPYAPLLYDVNVQAVDGRFLQLNEPNADTFFTLVSTNYGVYEIKEARLYPSQISSLSVSEVVTGTYLCNATAASFPVDDPVNGKIFIGTDRGLIKKFDNTLGWYLVGLGFEAGATEKAVTDISFDVGLQNNFHVMASSRGETDGRVMYSSDYGSHWSNYSPSGSPVVNAANLDHISSPQLSYAAGEGGGLWQSTVYGYSWDNIWFVANPEYNDILADTVENVVRYLFACGQGNTKAAMHDGSSWSYIQDGLSAVTSLNQLAVNEGALLYSVYAATDKGVYKIYNYLNSQTWQPRTYGMGEANVTTILSANKYNYLASGLSAQQEPMIWASGDSCRSWVPLYAGHMAVDDASPNDLALSQAGSAGFVAATDMAAYHLPYIFKAGEYGAPQTWGPGTIIINGDVLIEGQGNSLTFVAPCTVYVVYNFDISPIIGEDPTKSCIYIGDGASLTAIGDPDHRILFTSSRPTDKAAGDWTGIVFNDNKGTSALHMEYCDVEYAVRGIYDYPSRQHSQFRAGR